MPERLPGVVFPTPLPAKPGELDPIPSAELLAGLVGKTIAFGVPAEFPANTAFRRVDPGQREARGFEPLMVQYNVPLGNAEEQDAIAGTVEKIYDHHTHADDVLIQFDISAHTKSPETFPGTHLLRGKAIDTLGRTIARAAFMHPPNANIGLHVGYDWNVDQSLGRAPMSNLVRIINSAVEQWPTGVRQPRYVHVPFGLDRLGRIPSSEGYYQPLAKLRLEDTRLAAGIIEVPPEDLKQKEAFVMRTVDIRNRLRRLGPSQIDVAPAFDLGSRPYPEALALVRTSESTARIKKSPPQPRH